MFRSIRFKLTVWYIAVLAVMMAAFALVTYSFLAGALKRETDENLEEMAKSVAESVRGDRGDEERERPPDDTVKDGLEEVRFHDYLFAVYTNDDKLIGGTTETELPAELQTATGDNRFGTIEINARPYRVFMQPFHIEQHNYKIYALHSLNDQLALEARIRRIFYIAFPLLLLFGGLGGYFLARKSLEPVSAMAERAKDITAANLHQRLPIANPKDELGNLALSFNDLLDRLDVEFDRQRRFMADASHELRTPLAIIRGESEVALLKDTRESAEYQESLRVVNDESKRLTKIVEDLFTLARADSGELKADLRELYLDEVVTDCVRSVRTLAEKRSISIQLNAVETPIRGDETLLRRLFLNLMDNAVKYNFEGGTVRIDVADNTVVISNTGDEIPSEERASIFDRFYRVEKARTHTDDSITSGAGLGLSISKWIANLHGAVLGYSRTADEENTFSVVFPK
jgi:two-component system OmpR family sensor kinase